MKIIHLSDLHFGTEQHAPLNALIQDIAFENADVIANSGDSTQRARTPQYQAMKKFIDVLNTDIISVPGNHDIALYNLIERFFYPFKQYQRWIDPSLCKYYTKDNVVILGINSVTPFKPMGGYVTQKQLDFVVDFFKSQPQGQTRIIMMHHNLIRSDRHKIINDADKIINVFASCNINMVISGHLHLARHELLGKNQANQPMYVITAGTAISNRTHESNSYNIIEINDQQFKLTVKSFVDNQFIITKEIVLHRSY